MMLRPFVSRILPSLDDIPDHALQKDMVQRTRWSVLVPTANTAFREEAPHFSRWPSSGPAVFFGELSF